MNLGHRRIGLISHHQPHALPFAAPLQRRRGYELVLAESDEMAVGALKTVRDAGLHVPGDVSIIGFDDHDVAAYCDLTTVAQPVQQQGETAATLLIEHMNDDTGTHETTSVVLPTKIVVRSTTGPHRSGRADIAAVP